MYKYNSITFLLATLGVFVLVLKTGNALECYECNSHTQQECWTPRKNSTTISITDCAAKRKDAKFVACRKVLQIIDFEVNGLPPDTRVVRSCAYEPQEIDKCYQRSGFGGRQEVCACQGDLCNNSHTNKLNIAVLLAASVVAAFAFRHHS